MPTFIVNEKQLSVQKEKERKHYGIYLFEKPNVWHKVATFISDEGAEHFIKYLDEMFKEVEEALRYGKPKY